MYYPKRKTSSFQSAIALLALVLSISIFSSCAVDTVALVIDLLPEVEVEPILPPTTRWQNYVGDTNARRKTTTDLFKLENGQLAVANQKDALTISVIDPASGRTIATHTTGLHGTYYPRDVQSNIAIGNDLLLSTATGAARVNALTGATLWATTRKGRMFITEAGIIVYEHTYEGSAYLYLIDPTTGTEQLVKTWTPAEAELFQISNAYAVEGPAGETLIAISVQPFIQQGTFVGDIHFEVRSASDYSLRWSHFLVAEAESFIGAPILSNGQLLTAIGNTAYSFSQDSGDITWQYTFSPETYVSSSGNRTVLHNFSFRQLDVDLDQKILIASGYSQSIAINTETGQRLWSKDLDNHNRGISIHNDDYASYTTAEGYGVLIDPQSGFELGRVNPLNGGHPSFYSSAHLTSDGEAAILYDGISVYAINLIEFKPPE